MFALSIPSSKGGLKVVFPCFFIFPGLFRLPSTTLENIQGLKKAGIGALTSHVSFINVLVNLLVS